MTRRKWTTPEQEAWFLSHNNEFRVAEANNARKAFYKKNMDEWLERWPNPEPTEQQIKTAKTVEQARKNIFLFQQKVSHRKVIRALEYDSPLTSV